MSLCVALSPAMYAMRPLLQRSSHPKICIRDLTRLTSQIVSTPPVPKPTGICFVSSRRLAYRLVACCEQNNRNE
jgi:hypothetical protein